MTLKIPQEQEPVENVRQKKLTDTKGALTRNTIETHSNEILAIITGVLSKEWKVDAKYITQQMQLRYKSKVDECTRVDEFIRVDLGEIAAEIESQLQYPELPRPEEKEIQRLMAGTIRTVLGYFVRAYPPKKNQGH